MFYDDQIVLEKALDWLGFPVSCGLVLWLDTNFNLE